MTSIPLPKTSTPAERAMASVGITTLDDVTRFTAKEIADLHGVGPKAIRILEAALKEHGMAFAAKK